MFIQVSSKLSPFQFWLSTSITVDNTSVPCWWSRQYGHLPFISHMPLQFSTANESQPAGLDFAADDLGLKNSFSSLGLQWHGFYTLDPQVSNFKTQTHQSLSRKAWRTRLMNAIWKHNEKTQPKTLCSELLRQFSDVLTNCCVTKSPKWAVKATADCILHIWMHKVYPFGMWLQSCLSHLKVRFQIHSKSHCYTTKCPHFYLRDVLSSFSYGHQSSCLLLWKKYVRVLTYFSFFSFHPLYQLFT